MTSNVGNNRLIPLLRLTTEKLLIPARTRKRNLLQRQLPASCSLFPLSASTLQNRPANHSLRLNQTKAQDDLVANINNSSVSTLSTRTNEFESDLVVVLDMDECIIHSELTISSDADNRYRQYEAGRPDAKRRDENEPECIIPSSCESFQLSLPDGDIVHVNKRPNLDFFLREVTSRYKTYIFTAAMEIYASPLLDTLEKGQTMFAGRFYRESCRFDSHLGVYVKDLNNIKRLGESEGNDDSEPIFNDKKVVLVDNNPYSFLANPKNGILVSNFYDDPNDDTLHAVLDLLKEIDSVEDVRPILDEKFGLKNALKEVSNAQYWS